MEQERESLLNGMTMGNHHAMQKSKGNSNPPPNCPIDRYQSHSLCEAVLIKKKHTMTIQEKAIQWFKDRGINAKAFDDLVLIDVQEYEVLVSMSEVEYRAELFEEENP